MKGLLIILVAWGHVTHAELPEWALSIRHVIYMFHMPAFMFTSGYIFVHAGSHRTPLSAYPSYLARRAGRLLTPFFVIAVLVIMAKLAVQGFATVNRPIAEVWRPFANLFVQTEQSTALFIWYLAVLYIFSAIVPIASGGRHIGLILLFAASVLAHVAHIALFYQGVVLDTLYFNRVLLYFIFFMLGALARAHDLHWRRALHRAGVAIPLLAACVMAIVSWHSEWRYALVGLPAIMALHAWLSSLQRAPLLEILGRNSMAIYLFNVFFIGAYREIFLMASDVQAHTWGLLVGGALCGVLGPMVIRKIATALRELRPLARMIS